MSYFAPLIPTPIDTSERDYLTKRLKNDERVSKLRGHKPLLTLLLSGLMLSLAGCNSGSLSEAAAKFSDHEDQNCVRVSQPFKHSLCSVSQEQLSDPKAATQLKLFWKAHDAALINDADSDVAHSDLSSHPSKSPSSGDPSSGNPSSGNTSRAANSPEQKPLYTFQALLNSLPDKSKLKFAVNAGMYNNDFAPIGYTVINGHEIRALNLKEGGGNFHLLPNGVLWWDHSGKVAITESHEMQQMLADGKAKPWYATQSGPMLVIKGDIHPKFDPNSTSLKFRNGVGVCTDGQVKFVNSDQPVSFYQLAALFKDDLSCPNALFLDGGVASALYAPDLHQEDDKNMGVMVGVVQDQ